VIDADDGPGDERTSFRVWVNQNPGRPPNKGAVLKDGPGVKKTVELTEYGSPETGSTRKRELRFKTLYAGSGPTAGTEKATWACENDEIDRLLAWLHSDVERTGRFQLVDADSPAAALLDLLRRRDTGTQDIVDALTQHADVGELIHLLARSDTGLSAAESAVRDQRRALINRLRAMIEDPVTTETSIQALIGHAHWIFGGHYVGVAQQRSFGVLDQVDIPLIRGDGALHIVELKRPRIPRLLAQPRKHWIVGKDIHEATAQVMNYIRALDETGLATSKQFENELGQTYDMSRVFATVVIGHSALDHPAKDFDDDLVTRTLRQYNAGINRVDVITYDQLLDAAERSLTFEDQVDRSRRGRCT
jgi:hypothetical protein